MSAHSLRTRMMWTMHLRYMARMSEERDFVTVTHFACTNCLWKRECRAIGSEEVPVPGEILPVMRGTL